MSLKDNLRWANKAVSTVNQIISLGSATRQSYRGRQKNPKTQMCIVSQREMQVFCAERQIMFQPKTRRNSLQIDCAAKMARTYGCGNCGDMAALAFTFLKQWGVKPLDLMKCVNRDHMFVIIGMRDNAKPSDRRTWGSDAVVCDPWAPGKLGWENGRYYPAIFIEREMIGGSNTRYTSVQRFPESDSLNF